MTDTQPPLTPPKNLEAFQALLEIDEKERNFKARQGYLGAYFLSLLIPPIGVYFFVKYLFFSNGGPDDVRAGVISLGLTIASLLGSILLLGFMLGSGSMGDASKNIDTLKQFVTPANQQQFKDLMQ